LIALERLAQLVPDDPALALALAELRVNEGKTDSARLALERAFTLTNPYPYRPALLLRARLRLADEQLAEALEDCEQALTIAPDDIEGLTLRGLVRLELDDKGGARADLEQAGLADKPRQARLLAKVGGGLARRARELFKPSTASTPRPRPQARPTTPSRVGAGQPASQGGIPWGELPAALLANLEARVEGIQPSEAREALLEALRLGAQGESWTRIETALTRAGELAPDAQQVCLERIRVSVGQGRPAEASALLQEASQRGWRGPAFDLLRADAAWRAGDVGEAAMGLRSLAKGEGYAASYAAGLLGLLHGDDEAADAAAQRALAQRPNDGAALLVRALVAGLAGRTELAEAVYDLQGLLDLRLVAFLQLGGLASEQAAWQALGGLLNPGVQQVWKRADHTRLLTFDLMSRAPSEQAALASSALTISLRGSGQSYYHLAYARHHRRLGNAKKALASWKRVQVLSPAFGVPEPDRARLRQAFPRDERFARLWGE
jgi:tetratricopeptide (TPR) repeat protein